MLCLQCAEQRCKNPPKRARLSSPPSEEDDEGIITIYDLDKQPHVKAARPKKTPFKPSGQLWEMDKELKEWIRDHHTPFETPFERDIPTEGILTTMQLRQDVSHWLQQHKRILSLRIPGHTPTASTTLLSTTLPEPAKLIDWPLRALWLNVSALHRMSKEESDWCLDVVAYAPNLTTLQLKFNGTGSHIVQWADKIQERLVIRSTGVPV